MKSNLSAACKACVASRSVQLQKLGLRLDKWDYVVALAGNPNVGKSTVFNELTGLRQHTGNWPGKTISRAEGGYAYAGKRVKLIDLPGTYSLLSASQDEEIARNCILFARPDVTVVVADATRLERNFNLILQVLQITDRAVIAMNLIDEAKACGITIDERGLAKKLGVPVVPTAARSGKGMDHLLRMIDEVATGSFQCTPYRPRLNIPVVRDALDTLTQKVKHMYPDLSQPEWIAYRLLEGDEEIRKAIESGELGAIQGDHASSLISSMAEAS